MKGVKEGGIAREEDMNADRDPDQQWRQAVEEIRFEQAYALASQLPKTGIKKSLIISRPFISLRTGEPTVYLVRPLSPGGCVVGELNLGLFQQAITNITSRSGQDLVFIMDQSGTLLAHPSSDLVKQQTNLSNLEIFHLNVEGKANAVYQYDGTIVLGSVARVERTGWVVVDQIPFWF